MKNVRILLCTRERPLAFTYGVLRPTVLLSTWMVTQLDLRELEAVLTHELEHVARRDYLIVWFATVLRDAFFYLPTSRMAYRQLQQEKEFACDDMAVEVTHRPLALASAFHSLALDTIPEGPSSHLCAAAMAFSSVTVVGKILLHLLLALQVITIYYW